MAIEQRAYKMDKYQNTCSDSTMLILSLYYYFVSLLLLLLFYDKVNKDLGSKSAQKFFFPQILR